MSGRLRFFHYEQELPEPFLRSFDLQYESVPDAVITPIHRLKRRFYGGVYDSAGKLLSHSERKTSRGTQAQNPPQITPAPVRRIAGRSFFAGVLFTTFGHMLLESPSRMWAWQRALDEGPIANVLFQGWLAQIVKDPLKASYCRFVLKALGIDLERIQILSEEVVCDELIVPSSTVSVNGFSHPRFVEPYDRIVGTVERKPSPLSRIYLSRSKLHNQKRLVENELDIEALATERGYTILHPQTLPFEEQINIMQQVEVIAGCDGSALHMAAFARPGTRLLAFEGRPSMNQYGIDSARGLDAAHVLVNTGKYSGKGSPSWLADIERVREGFDLIDAEAGRAPIPAVVYESSSKPIVVELDAESADVESEDADSTGIGSADTEFPTPIRAEEKDVAMSAIPIENGLKLFQAYDAVRPPKAGMGYDSVVVWLFLGGVQDVLGAKGDVLEIGVRFGGSALLELLMVRPDEKVYLVDVERTAEFDRRLGMLEKAQQQRMEFFVMPSDDARLQPVRDRKYRWIHIDANHEYAYAKGDIERFADSLSEDGVLVLDDFFQFAWPDVTTATYEFLAARSDWKMLLIGFNKAYLVRAAAKPRFMAVIEKEMGAYFETFGKFQVSSALPMGGDLVCMAKGFPNKMVDRSAKRAGKAEIETGERRGKRRLAEV